MRPWQSFVVVSVRANACASVMIEPEAEDAMQCWLRHYLSGLALRGW